MWPTQAHSLTFVKIDGIDIPQSVASIKAQVEADPALSASLRAAVERLLPIVILLCNRLGLNSKKISKSPPSDPNREKPQRTTSNTQPGGQNGRGRHPDSR